jgi:hypothetical protein
MKADGFDYTDEQSFMRQFGVVRHSSRYATRSGGQQGDRIGSLSEKRLPGVSPLVFTKYLLENATFLSLSDMAEGLPEYEEIPSPIQMDEELSNAYHDLETELRQAIGFHGNGGMKAMGSFLQALSVFPDMPYDQPPVLHPDTNEVLVTPPSLERGLRVKDNALLELVREKKEAGEKVLIYYHWTNRTDLAERFTKMFADNDITSLVLDSHVSPEKREQWIEDRQDGIDVLICNPTLVETGLDLLPLPRLYSIKLGIIFLRCVRHLGDRGDFRRRIQSKYTSCITLAQFRSRHFLLWLQNCRHPWQSRAASQKKVYAQCRTTRIFSLRLQTLLLTASSIQ